MYITFRIFRFIKNTKKIYEHILFTFKYHYSVFKVSARDMIKARIASDNELSSLSPNVIPNISAANKLNAPFSRNYYDRETKREK